MAEKVWQAIRTYHCDRVNCDVELEAEAIYPADIMPDQAPRLSAHRCSHAQECMMMEKITCTWAGSNPGYDPFQV